MSDEHAERTLMANVEAILDDAAEAVEHQHMLVGAMSWMHDVRDRAQAGDDLSDLDRRGLVALLEKEIERVWARIEGMEIR